MSNLIVRYVVPLLSLVLCGKCSLGADRSVEISGAVVEISGVVVDISNSSPIPYVNIQETNTRNGSITDISGLFSLHVTSIPCSLSVSSLGYRDTTVVITHAMVSGGQIAIKLSPNVEAIDIVTVTPSKKRDYSRRNILWRRIQDRRGYNRDALNGVSPFYSHERTVVLQRVDSTNRVVKWFKSAEDISIESRGKRYLPIYISNSDIDYPEGLKGESIEKSRDENGMFPALNKQLSSLILNKIALECNFYNNKVTILDRDFPSPVGPTAMLFYNIHLSDSAVVDNTKQYKFSFFPKDRHGALFQGSFWVEDVSYALTNIEADVLPSANINFSKELRIVQNYRKLDSGVWFYSSNRFSMVMALNKDGDSSSDILIDISNHYSLLTLESYKPDELEIDAERGIVVAHNEPLVKSVDKIGSMFLSGYLSLGKVDFGSIQDLVSSNIIEGNRFTLPFRTSKEMHPNISLNGYLGYGMSSKEVKYGIGADWKAAKSSKHRISINYSDDYSAITRDKFIDYIKENPFSRGDGNLISSLTSSDQNPYIVSEKILNLKYRVDLSNSIGLTINPYYGIYGSTEYVPFTHIGEDLDRGVDVGSYRNYGVLMDLRFSFNQSYDELFFDRIYYGNMKPVIHITSDYSVVSAPMEGADIRGSYWHLHGSIKSRFSLGLPYVQSMVNVGYMVGDIPYPSLEMPSGTQSLGYSRFSYNLLNYGAFAHNLYTNIHLNINGAGILFNRLPLISRLGLREIISIKSYYGVKTSQCRDLFQIPEAFQRELNSPYVELGVGVGNIFNVGRIEYVKLMGDSQGEDYASSSGIRVRFEISF